ncbi:hemolymph clottable protein-like isoform X2 [Oratosquilla oratoria]|uniref:hemolymph clottable protein-like isoform X2 n=1 Tax=Oratosquilla oratoria TaxID=337810 RepID=UPI003F75845C
MKTSYILLSLLGLASALQHGLEYEYSYESRIATGIPEIQRQYAGASLRASVTVQLLGEDLIAQISNIEVADMNGLAECDSKASLPLTYEPLVDHVGVFQEPFFINGTDSLVVPQGEPYWITNIRKAVATLFTVKPLRTPGNELNGLFQTYAFKNPAVVVDEEQSLAGICQHNYVLTKLPDYLKEEHVEYIEATVEEDVQSDIGPSASDTLKSKGGHGKVSKSRFKGSKSYTGGKGNYKGGKGGKSKVNAPKLGDDIFVLTRIIDFDECQTLVKFQNFGHGIYCKMGTSQCGTLLSRSSTGSFTLRGSPDALRIEKVEIEGNVLINPLGYETEKIRTVTNQTLKLKAVRHQCTPLTLPDSTRKVDSFMYEVESPVSSVNGDIHPFVHHPPMHQNKPHGFFPMHIVAGLSGKVSETQADAMRKLNELFDQLHLDLKKFDVIHDNNSNVAERMEVIVDLIRILDYNDLDHLYKSYLQDDSMHSMREMLVDAMAKAGTDAAVRVLVEQIKSRTISTERSAQVFMGLTNSLQMPDHSFPHLLELLKSLDMAQEFDLTSSLILNMGTAINRLCLAPWADDSQQKLLLGHRYCNPKVILAQFLPIVEKGLQNDKDTSHKMVYIYALTMMTTIQKLPILKPIVVGTTETDVRVRSLAIYALQKCNTPGVIMKEIFKLLMPVFEYQGEHHIVRMAAIGSLLTWKPRTAWWHRLAVASWRDPSRQMQSYISHFIESVAERHGEKFDTLRQRATHVLPMTKHCPSSKQFSNSFLTGAYFEAIETGIVLNAQFIYNMKNYIPVHIYYIFISHQGSFLNMIHEMTFDNNIWNIFKELITLNEDPEDMESRDNHHARILYISALEALRMDEDTHFEKLETIKDSSNELILAIRSFFNVQRVFKIKMLDLILTFAAHNKLPTMNFAKYANPIEIFISFPTDVGLPFVGTVTTPLTLYSNEETHPLGMPEVDLNLFMSFQVETRAQVLTPWNGQAVTSGFRVREDFVLPLSASIIQGGFSLAIKAQEKVSLGTRFNQPFTVRAPFITPSPMSELKDFRIIHNRRKPFKDHINLGKKYTGMALDHKWEGDVVSPFNHPSLIKLFSKNVGEHFRSSLAPTLQHSESRIIFDPEQSSTSTVKLTFMADFVKDSHDQSTQDSQFSQKSGNDYIYSDYDNYMESPDTTFTGLFSLSDSPKDRLVKLKQKQKSMKAPNSGFFNGRVEFEGSKHYMYDMVLLWELRKDRDLKEMNSLTHIILTRDLDKVEHVMCISAKTSHPYLSPLLDIKDTLNHKLRSKFSLSIHNGENCLLDPIVKAKGSLDMTQHRKDTILSTLKSKDFCAKDLEVQEHIQAVYDEFNLKIIWDQKQMDMSSLQNIAYHLDNSIEGFLLPDVTHSYDRVQNTPSVVTINATRSMDTNHWTIRTYKPSETSIVDHVQLSKMIDDLVSFDHGIPLFYNKCYIYEDHVNTFDGMIYPLERNSCWRVLAMDVENYKSWMLLYRYEPGTYLRFINPRGKIVADIMPNQVKVNGKPVVMASDYEVVRQGERTLCTVEMYNDQIYVNFPGILAVSLKDSHIVIETKLVTTGGLCGASDGEVTGDLQGPNRCVYYKPELFSASWSAGGDGGECDPYTMNDLFTKVEDYQQHCPKFQSQATGPAHDWY